MATAKKAPAAKKAAPTRKPPAPVIEVKRAPPPAEPKPGAAVVQVTSGEEAVKTYKVMGRIRRGDLVLRPADKVLGRDADTVELTEREAYGLRGFVELIDDANDEASTETE